MQFQQISETPGSLSQIGMHNLMNNPVGGNLGALKEPVPAAHAAIGLPLPTTTSSNEKFAFTRSSDKDQRVACS